MLRDPRRTPVPKGLYIIGTALIRLPLDRTIRLAIEELNSSGEFMLVDEPDALDYNFGIGHHGPRLYTNCSSESGSDGQLP